MSSEWIREERETGHVKLVDKGWDEKWACPTSGWKTGLVIQFPVICNSDTVLTNG